jgi:hypothetical protein
MATTPTSQTVAATPTATTLQACIAVTIPEAMIDTVAAAILSGAVMVQTSMSATAAVIRMGPYRRSFRKVEFAAGIRPITD